MQLCIAPVPHAAPPTLWQRLGSSLLCSVLALVLVAFLASPRAGYITGTTLHVNGGMYMS